MARILSEELTDEDLKSITGGCDATGGQTCTASLGVGAADTDGGLDSAF